MKKLLALLLVVVMIFALCACGESSNDSSEGSTDTESAEENADVEDASESVEENVDIEDNSDSETSEEDAQNADLEPVTLSWSDYCSTGEPGMKNPELLQDKVNEILGGDYLTIDVYASNTLGTNTTMLDDVTSGVSDMGHFQVSANSSLLPMCQLFQTAGAASFQSAIAASYAFKDYVNEVAPAELEDVIVLFVVAAGPGAIVTNFDAFGMDDLAGRMIRGTSSTSDSLTAWGANPVSLDWSECYESMRNNLIEGIYTTSGAVAANNFDDVVKYHIYAPWYNDCELYIMNKDVFASLPDAMQDALMQASQETFEEYTCSMLDMVTSVKEQDFYQRYLSNIEAVVFFSDEDVDKMSDAIATIADDYAEELDAQGYDATGALATARELADKYNALYDNTGELREIIESYGGTVIES